MTPVALSSRRSVILLFSILEEVQCKVGHCSYRHWEKEL